MSVSVDKLYSVADTAPAGERAGRSRIAISSPLIGYSAAAAGSIVVWFGIFKIIFG